MQYISKQYQISHPYILPIIAIIHWLIFYIRYNNSNTITYNKIITFILIFNTFTINECINHSQNVISTVLIIMFIIQWKGFGYQYVCAIVFGVVWPYSMPILALRILLYNNGQTKIKKIIKQQQHSKQEEFRKVQQQFQINIKQISQAIVLLVIGLLSIYYLHYQLYFPKYFSKNSGISWLLYSHMFKRYLGLYQTIMNICPFVIIFPLTLLKASLYTKLSIQWFITIYAFNSTSLIHILALYFLQSHIYPQVMNKANKRKQVIWNVLTILNVFLSICSYSFMERLYWLWTHTHLVAIGYILVQILLFWGTHAVYLSQALTILDQQEKQQKKVTIKERIKDYFVTKLKQL